MLEAVVSLQTASIVTLVLFIKFYVSNFSLGAAKGRAGMRPPEDQWQAAEIGEDAKQAADRAQRIVTNDLENIPFGLIFLWASGDCSL